MRSTRSGGAATKKAAGAGYMALGNYHRGDRCRGSCTEAIARPVLGAHSIGGICRGLSGGRGGPSRLSGTIHTKIHEEASPAQSLQEEDSHENRKEEAMTLSAAHVLLRFGARGGGSKTHPAQEARRRHTAETLRVRSGRFRSCMGCGS